LGTYKGVVSQWCNRAVPRIDPLEVRGGRRPENMAAEENKAILQRFNEVVGEVFRTGNVDALDEVLAPEFVYHQPGAPPDLESYKQFLAMFGLAYPDVSLTVEDMIAEEIRWWTASRGRLPTKGRLWAFPRPVIGLWLQRYT
jgi:hypothetical protein